MIYSGANFYTKETQKKVTYPCIVIEVTTGKNRRFGIHARYLKNLWTESDSVWLSVIDSSKSIDQNRKYWYDIVKRYVESMGK